MNLFYILIDTAIALFHVSYFNYLIGIIVILTLCNIFIRTLK